MGVHTFIWEKLNGVAEGVLSLLYPPRCSLCLKCGQTEDCRFFCKECFDRVLQSEVPPVRYWPHSQAFSLASIECDLAAWYYEAALLALVPRMKYQQRPGLARILAEIAAERMRAQIIAAVAQLKKEGALEPILAPVPLHVRRLRERGYNQSLLIAREFSQRWRIEVLPHALRRARFTQPQVKLNASERLQNVQGVFAVDRAEKFAGRIVLLVDDVITTGATVSECARVVQQAGAAGVIAVALARTGRDLRHNDHAKV